MLIDAHAHLWTLARGDYAWLTPDLADLYRDFSIDDYRSAATGVDGVVLVQAAATQAETDYLLAIAATDPLVLGVVGWLEFAHPAAAAWLDARTGARGLVGVRPMLHDLADPHWLEQPEQDAVLTLLAARGIALDLLIRPVHLPIVARIAARHPTLRLIVDHLAKPAVAARGWQPWADDLALAAARPNVWCKLSGLVTEAGPGADVEALLPYAAHAARLFGDRRLIWGSDWPVCTQRMTFAAWLEMAREIADRLELDRDRVFAANAAAAYRFGR